MTDRTLGILTGILIGAIIGIALLIVIWKVTKTDGAIRCKYDERQELVRGKGFKYAFFAMLIYNSVMACLLSVFDSFPIGGSAALEIGIILGLLVYATYAIWNEAYFSLNENPRKVMIALICIGLSNLLLGILQIVEGRFIENGVLTFRSINFFMGIALVFIFAVLVVKQICRKREED